MIVVLVIAKVTIKYMSQWTKNQGKHIQIIEKNQIGKETSLCITKVCQTYYLMSVGQDKISMMKELTDDEVQEILTAQKQAEKTRELQMNQYKQTSQSVLQKVISFVGKRKQP